MSSAAATVVAVVVAYHPQGAMLRQLLTRLQTQVAAVVVVDNGSAGTVAAVLAECGEARFHHLDLGANLGVASGLNRGAERALALGATHLLLLDQDSLPAPDMVEKLLAACTAKQNAGVPVAVVGPRYVDERADNPPPFLRIEGYRLVRQQCVADGMPEVEYLITSGSLIPAAAWQAVGGMVDELFIDYVDIEWGLRARCKGWRAFGVCAAGMAHSLGNEPARFFGRRYPVHSPLRDYYHFRNAVWLYRQAWVPGNWKVVDASRLLLRFGFYALITPPRLQHLGAMLHGIWHGLRGRLGVR